MIAAISSDVATGRRMKMRDGLTPGFRRAASLGAAPPPLPVVALRRIGRRTWLRCRTARRWRWRSVLALGFWLCGGGGGTARDPYLRAILQPIGAVDDDNLARLQPLCDDDPLVVPGPKRHWLCRDRLVGFDDIDKGARRAALHRRVRHQIGPRQRVDQQLDVDELIGVEHLLCIVEDRSQFDGAEQVLYRSEEHTSELQSHSFIPYA